MKKILVSTAIALSLVTGYAGFSAVAQAAEAALSGKVVETMNSGGYTYVQLDSKGKKTWVAVPEMKVTKGKTMSFKPGAEMKNFTSKSLKKTFESIIFSEGPSK